MDGDPGGEVVAYVSVWKVTDCQRDGLRRQPARAALCILLQNSRLFVIIQMALHLAVEDVKVEGEIDQTTEPALLLGLLGLLALGLGGFELSFCPAMIRDDLEQITKYHLCAELGVFEAYKNACLNLKGVAMGGLKGKSKIHPFEGLLNLPSVVRTQ
jgi:hypothetical protein